ncbi:hypothetical protein [Pseudorhodoferax sp. Leaf274]|uniref:hypothetical protein n=1 Tax=Pseudorhodoferax sp. Leaf274 TaxID=1736318 RepID=UPI0007033DA5|nr:hypothetical protein [Pseudorhodoferax sp. Leaf274]KQP39790.1 hypothetical protein ASF44_08675 [Pseudorhodoferax sp. Leaf274]
MTTDTDHWGERLLPWLVLAAGVASGFFAWWNRGSLWEDELIALTHGLQPLPGFFMEVVRNDIHPFFYFLVLKAWAGVNIGSDSWVLFSSLAMALFSTAVLYAITTQVHGRRAAAWAAALFCVLPSFAMIAGNLRMYGLVPALALGCWFANREFLRTGDLRAMAAILLVQAMLAYTHAIGFFFLPFFGLAALWQQWPTMEHPRLHRLKIWVAVQAFSVLTVLPLAFSALIRGTEPLSAPSVDSLVLYPAQLLAWWPIAQRQSLLLGGVVFAFLLALGAWRRNGRVTLLAVPCGALLACMLISSLGKPMFKPPVFVACLVPFLALEAGAGLAAMRDGLLRHGAIAAVAGLAVLLWAWPAPQYAENYKPIAEQVAAKAQAGEVVVVPNLSVFWGVMRYAVGPRWGAPLEVMPLQSNASWTRLKDKLGPVWVERLGLAPRTDHIDHRGVRFVIGDTLVETAPRVWVVHRANYKEQVRLPQPMHAVSVSWSGDELSLSELRASPAGGTTYENPTAP